MLDMNMTFEEIEILLVWSFKSLVKRKVSPAGLKYLLTEQNKNKKIAHII